MKRGGLNIHLELLEANFTDHGEVFYDAKDWVATSWTPRATGQRVIATRDGATREQPPVRAAKGAESGVMATSENASGKQGRDTWSVIEDRGDYNTANESVRTLRHCSRKRRQQHTRDTTDLC